MVKKRILKEGMARRAISRKIIELRVLIGIIVGIFFCILLGFTFTLFVPLIPPSQQLIYWLLLGIGGPLAIFLIGGFIAGTPADVKYPSLTGSLGALLFINVIVFGIEGFIIAILFGGLWWIFNIGIGIVGLFFGTLFEDDFWVFGLLFLLISSYILGIIFGNGLAIIALIIFISTIITMLISNLRISSKGDSS
ncbi:MAG: hypothetical protein ACFFD2_10740 [Promethearchaeota archaeon]